MLGPGKKPKLKYCIYHHRAGLVFFVRHRIKNSLYLNVDKQGNISWHSTSELNLTSFELEVAGNILEALEKLSMVLDYCDAMRDVSTSL